jgi:tetraacyldisaccharide 4'-kinase
LRENIENLKNYDHIFLNGNLENLENIKKKILSINSKTNIHVGKYEAVNIDEFNKNENYLVFSGIGNHKSFIKMIKNEGLNIIKDLEFPDHYKYTEIDINKIIMDAKNLKCKIITTEKDFQRLKNLNSKEIKILKSKINILDEEKFLKAIL